MVRSTIQVWEDGESFHMIGALDDFGLEVGQDARQAVVKYRPLIGRVGKELFQERMHPKHGGKQHNAAVPVLDVGTVNEFAWSNKPNVSTRTWRFLPLIFLPAS